MHKKTLSLLLSLAMLLSMFAIIPANAAETAAEPVGVSKVDSPSDFSWDNANVYFLMTDRFYNGNKSNDHSYGRALDQNGKALSGWNTAPGTFHGGDFAGLTQKINEGYFDKLGTTALWITAPYEQIHGYVTSGDSTSPQHFAHYSYHGYYVLDYTETDANFGTKQEFKTMVDAAHKHGIRVVMDIVINHAGYNNLLDMESYGYGTLKSGYQQCKYRLTNANDFHAYIDYNSSASDWGKWWGPSWIRSGLPGYEEGGGEVTGCLAGLPDFRTESTATVGIPQFLQTKWSKEGTLNAQKTRYSSCRTVNDYLTTWLSEWVENYGVDGFRCDTAKHVEMDSWVKLKKKCVAALKKWRQNNPSADGADWDEDFWMTGEHWGHGLGKDGYFTSGAFDSMINFSVTGNVSQNPGGMPGVESINSMYQNYASNINSDPNYNMLTYISSHDTGLVRQNQYWQGTALQLLPGGIQIFYGDETSRPLVPGVAVEGSGHAVRSDMNFGQNNDLLAHWQKVGKFRANHIAVGAGTHQQISGYSSSTGYTFSRSYADENVSDGVVCCIGAPANKSISVNVSSMWGNGTTVTNFYDGSTATVSGGKVTFNSGANGTILIEGPQSTINMSIKGEYLFENSQKVTVLLRGADTATVSIKGGTPFTVRNGDTFTIGDGIELGEVFEVTMKATNATETLEKSFSFKKKDPYAVTTIYVDDSKTNWGNIKAYIYTGDGDSAQSVAAWPGVSMKYDSSRKLYSYEVPDAFVNGRVIFSGDGGRYPADMQPGLEIKETNMILKNGSQWEVYPDDNPPTNPTSPPEPKRTILMGDVNGDTKVNVVDASEIQLHIVELKTLTGDALLACDTTGDGSVNVKDVTAVQYYAADDSEHDSLCGKLVEVGSDTPVPTSPVEDPTQPTEKPDTSKHYIYCTSNWSSVTAYYWSDANEHMTSWPGVAMQSLGNKLFRVEVPGDATKIIFSNNGQGQTADLDIPGFNQCFDEGGSKTWGAVPGGGNEPSENPGGDTPSDKNYIYCTSNWDSVTAYYWSDANEHMTSWPGVAMQSLGNKLFRVEVPGDATKIIFSNNGQGQTADLDIPGFNQCFDEGGSKTWAPYNG